MKNFILVAGVDYKPVSHGKRGTDYNVYCEKRVKQLFAEEKGADDLKFYMMDFTRGKTNIILYTYDLKSKTYTKTASVHESFDAINQGNYYEVAPGSFRYHPQGKKNMSKYDIYKLIEEIGTYEAGTLVEVSIYSHAYFGGPILVNSNRQDAPYTDPINGTIVDVTAMGKDPNDNDMRIWDFSEYFNRPVGFTKLSYMKAAFASAGTMKIWGCSHPPTLHRFISKVRLHKSYKRTGLRNTDEFKFSPGRLDKEIRDFLASYLEYMRSLPFGFEIKKTDEVIFSWLEFKTIMCNQIIGTYCNYASVYLDKNVVGALPATYADISPKFKINSNTIPNVEMYKEYFGMEVGIGEELNYGIYKPTYNCTDYL